MSAFFFILPGLWKKTLVWLARSNEFLRSPAADAKRVGVENKEKHIPDVKVCYNCQVIT